MRRIVSGGKEIDLCSSCGAIWFDYGEIRELTGGRLNAAAETPGKSGTAISRMRAAAAVSRCPRCEESLTAVDFQATGIPVLHCAACEGILASRESASGIRAKFRFLRENEARYAALGETLAGESRRIMEKKYGTGNAGNPVGAGIPLPIVVPLATDASEPGALPLASYSLILVFVFLYAIGQVTGSPLTLPGGLPGLPSGTGFAGVPKLPLLFAPFFHAGFLPLAAGSLFLFVLGENVEERMGKIPFFTLFLFCGVVAGVAHVLWGKAGGPPSQGSAGSVAGILGAYLVFFPNVSIRMYGMGRLACLPAYLFACAWVIVAFFLAMDANPVMEFLNPAALSLAGNMAGFGTGVLCAIVWRFGEDDAARPLRRQTE
ncbi:MAG: rhomboid family intramembrane serine protease [Deltaproteobacteria bacterium]|nr:rhomboid family intramembrane serine protease [Deltaproteobacteria bacterium]